MNSKKPAAKITLLMVTVWLLTACAPATYVTLLNNTDGSVGEVMVKGTAGETIISKANTGALLDGSTKQPFAVDQQQLQNDFGQALKAQPALPESFLLYFQEGGTNLTPESEAMLPKISATIAARQEVDISIIGHSDTTEPAKINEKLSRERAVYVSSLFDPAKLKIKEMTVTSHGEKNLLIKTADEVSEPKNRRVEVTVR
ncbi:MAG: OmpA family protein [Methylococcales bacterium]